MAKFKKKRELTAAEKERFIQRQRELVARWRAAKAYAAENPDEFETMLARAQFVHGATPISPANFVFVYRQMQAEKMQGIPYVDARTFQKWRELGRSVRKGETARLWSVTWIGRPEPAAEAGEDEVMRFWPKTTALFHLSQTEELEEKSTPPMRGDAQASRLAARRHAELVGLG